MLPDDEDTPSDDGFWTTDTVEDDVTIAEDSVVLPASEVVKSDVAEDEDDEFLWTATISPQEVAWNPRTGEHYSISLAQVVDAFGDSPNKKPFIWGYLPPVTRFVSEDRKLYIVERPPTTHCVDFPDLNESIEVYLPWHLLCITQMDYSALRGLHTLEVQVYFTHGQVYTEEDELFGNMSPFRGVEIQAGPDMLEVWDEFLLNIYTSLYTINHLDKEDLEDLIPEHFMSEDPSDDATRIYLDAIKKWSTFSAEDIADSAFLPSTINSDEENDTFKDLINTSNSTEKSTVIMGELAAAKTLQEWFKALFEGAGVLVNSPSDTVNDSSSLPD